ncbi:MAG: SDR family NAD(P)-dependent oxidoreductase [Bacteroidales bacterium]|jgi:NAD(P)-dependent dehydrogenase (short-subunit alcohol dehydrogenase family)|nr:SDR family NAD(P)-dependent oxidoreductase [Bacteroidales bacterium]
MKRVALVTGANRGIGFAIVKELLIKGYKVILTARNESYGLKAVSELEEYGDVCFFKLDINDPLNVNNVLDFIISDVSRVDVLINNAGVNYDTWHSAINADLDQVKDTIDTNLFGAWRMIQALLPVMRRQNYGRIVNVSSGAGAFSEIGSGTPGYSISKAAMNVLTLKVAKELNGENILINSVCPGWVRTEMGECQLQEVLKKEQRL